MEKHEELAIMEGVSIGMRDCGQPVMWFCVRMMGCSALQVLNWESTEKLIKDANVYNIKELEGKPCIVESEGLGGITIFKRVGTV